MALYKPYKTSVYLNNNNNLKICMVPWGHDEYVDILQNMVCVSSLTIVQHPSFRSFIIPYQDLSITRPMEIWYTAL